VTRSGLRQQSKRGAVVTARQFLLAGVLARIGKFSLDSFQDRLKLQKTVYLLQAFGIFLGYNFNWYVYGPYSPGLASDAFGMAPGLTNFEPIWFSDPEVENRFEQFLRFVSQKKDSPDWLELVASIHMLRQMYPQKSREEIFDRMAAKQPHLPNEERVAAWGCLLRQGLI
jgi:uncharacterized protein YwgA